MNWSIEQQAIFEYGESGTGNRVVEARAGTGKTTTVKEMFNHCPENRILYAVFNKKNQREAQAKIKDSRVDIKTLNALGYAFVRRVWSNAKPDEDIEQERAESVLIGKGARQEIPGLVKGLVAWLKNTTAGMPTQDDAHRTMQAQDFGGNNEQEDELICCAALRVLELSKVRRPDGRISFDDQVWLPVVMGWVRPWYDMVCIDERQDMNLPQISMARQACKQGGRIIAVGDDRQAIYGFRGAMQDSSAMMRTVWRAQVLSLTVTYRCARRIVALAQQIVPDYQAAPDAPEGLVENCNEVKMAAEIRPGDAVLSRLNAPLMPLALSLLRRNIPARIEGKDIGKQLVGMVKSLKARTVPDLIERIAGWAEKQRARLENAKNAEKRVEQVNDIAATLQAIAEGARSVADVETKLMSLFQDTDEHSKPAVVLSSVHKAKGLEWGRVFMLTETFRKGKGTEEDNIWYVAVTRAMRELWMVAGKGEKADGKASQTTPAPASVPAQAQTAQVPAIAAPARLELVSSKADNYDLPGGMVRHKVGNVVRHSGTEYVCTQVNGSCARFTRLSKAVRVINHRVFGESSIETKQTEVEDRSGKNLSLSTACEPADILRVMSAAEVIEFLHGGKPAPRQSSVDEAGTNDNNETETDMAKKLQKKDGRKPIAGRADFIHAQKSKGVGKKEAFDAVVGKEFDCSKAAFDKIWDAKQHAAPAAKSTPPPRNGGKGGKKGGKPAQNAKPASVPPPRKAAPAPPAAPAPATHPMPAAAAAPAEASSAS